MPFASRGQTRAIATTHLGERKTTDMGAPLGSEASSSARNEQFRVTTWLPGALFSFFKYVLHMTSFTCFTCVCACVSPLHSSKSMLLIMPPNPLRQHFWCLTHVTSSKDHQQHIGQCWWSDLVGLLESLGRSTKGQSSNLTGGAPKAVWVM